MAAGTHSSLPTKGLCLPSLAVTEPAMTLPEEPHALLHHHHLSPAHPILTYDSLTLSWLQEKSRELALQVSAITSLFRLADTWRKRVLTASWWGKARSESRSY